MKSLILASQSPRRRELLSQLGFQFSCCPANIDESELPDETPAQYVERLAGEKAQYIANNQIDSAIVLGSDTCVVYQDKILGKPDNQQQCLEYLTLLSGNNHQVLTAIAVVQGRLIKSQVISTTVTFKSLSENEMLNYWRSGEPQDKAGGYGIQGLGGQFVTQINGSYSAVVGLPLYETAQLLAEFGLLTALQQPVNK
ncbi:Maf-like protein [Thalassotalea insulae]|uniref:dTTP/UTP pyrophosphatase n=1 Tax=Thalassotalea insulae TaxID=2056778 RepID=A0ABQ6GT36_9GAMM|nr:Maf family protein [Thalassotalea insulae]GLX77855.1 Maf-like protein [Thalassotalea insulae]